MVSVNFVISTLTVSIALNIVLICGQSQDMLTIFNKCKDESNATDDDIEIFKKQQISSTKTGKMSDGKFDMNGANTMATKVYQGNAAKTAKAKQVNEACFKELQTFEGDKCEIAAMVANCTMTTSVKMGLV